MLSCPRIGQRVRVHYAARYAARMPLQGKQGVVMIASRGRPRNHGVAIDGTMYVVPAGNLVTDEEEGAKSR